MLTRLRLLLWATALALAGEVCAGGALPRFSAQSAGAAIAGWTPWTLGGKAAPADFRLAGLDGQTVLRAEAVNAASALIHAGRFDTAATPWLNWRWRADRLPTGNRFATRDGDDYVLRVYVLFDYDIAKLPFGARTKLRIARALHGDQVPAAVLCYVWDNRAQPGTRAWSAYTDRVRMIAVEGDSAPTGVWRSASRNLRDDFREAFGEDAPPVIGVVVAADTDNTAGSSLGHFGDLSLDAQPQP